MVLGMFIITDILYNFADFFSIHTPFFRYINYPRLYFLNTMLIILFERQDRALQTFSFDKGNSVFD